MTVGSIGRISSLPDDGLAIEVELSQKASWRLDGILRAWRRAVGAGKFDAVRYLCGRASAATGREGGRANRH